MSKPVQIQFTLVDPVDQQLSARVIESKLMLLIKLIQQIAPEFEIKFDDPIIAFAREQLPRPKMPGLVSCHGGLRRLHWPNWKLFRLRRSNYLTH
jgi:hypothetical protein